MSTRELPEGFMYGHQVPRTHMPMPPQPRPTRRRQPPKTHPEVTCLSDALSLFRHHMPVNKLDDVKLTNARVAATYQHKGTGRVYLVMFKRETYRHFARHFPDVPEKDIADQREGMICNYKLVAWAAGENIILTVLFPDARAYIMEALDFWNYYEKHGTDVKHAPGEIATPISKWARLF